MNGKNLPLKFAVLALLIAVCIVSIKSKGIREGIDLRGGHSITLGIQTAKADQLKAEAARTKLEADLAKAGNDQKPEIEKKIQDLDKKIQDLKNAGDDREIAQEMIAILKDRIDPTGLRALEWRPLSGNRIEVRMPASTEANRLTLQEYQAKLDALTANPVLASKLDEIEKLPADQQEKQIAEIAARDKSQAQDIKKLVELKAQIARQTQKVADLEAKTPATTQPATQPSDAGWELLQANRQLDDLRLKQYLPTRQKIEQSNLTAKSLSGILSNYVSKDEAEALKKAGKSDEVSQRNKQYKRDIDTLLKNHADRKDEILALKDSYEKWAENREQLGDPNDLMRLIRKSGVLEFRIAPKIAEITDAPKYQEQLAREGAEPGRERNDPFVWFAVHSKDEKFAEQGLLTANYAGKQYVLLHNREGNMMLNPPGGREWTLEDAQPTQGSNGGNAISFTFDARGADIFAALTKAHLQQPMAILLDDEIYSAPTIQAVISAKGEITGSFTPQEASELAKTLRSGSLPAKLNPEPLAVSSFGSALGQVNKDKSIHAGEICMIAICVFMVIYYFLNGLLADFALVLNILFIIGGMSLLDASFTLPGIAGIILTIGMAVDANVLINERLREEQERGLPIRTAVKNAYDRAFSAIFDSHFTVLVTCLILGWVGTEEVRGFAISLGLGIVINLFTAVWVTRWCLQTILSPHMPTWLHWLHKGKFRMLPFLKVPHIDWVGKRYYFWAFSLFCSVIGIVAICVQGSNLWGIEFSAGTQATLVFKSDAMLDGKLLDDNLVGQKFKKAAEELYASGKDPKFKQISESPRVESVLDADAAEAFLTHFDVNHDGKVTLAEFLDSKVHEPGNQTFFQALDANNDKTLDKDELAKLQEHPVAYRVNTTEQNVGVIKEVAKKAFGNEMVNRQKLTYDFAKSNSKWTSELGVNLASDGLTQINAGTLEQNPKLADIANFNGGVLMVLENVEPAITQPEFVGRLKEMQVQADAVSAVAMNMHQVVGLGKPEDGRYKAFAVMARQSEGPMTGNEQAWKGFANSEKNLVETVLDRDDSIMAINFDKQIAGETAQLALVAVVLSWLAITGYLWFRFGSASWGLAAVVCLIHDSLMVVGFVAMSEWISGTSIGKMLLVGSYKLDLTIVAAVLTVVGYSVNDTIVIFDRIRENRGKLKTVSPQIINLSINQTMTRTILTTFTVLLVVAIMYALAGESIRGFNYSLLIGCFFGCYSTVAVAAPLLLGLKAMVSRKTVTAEIVQPTIPSPAAGTQMGK